MSESKSAHPADQVRLRKRRVVGCFVILSGIVCGCTADMKAQSPYWGVKPIRIEAQEAPFGAPKILDVYLHPENATRAAVWPRYRTVLASSTDVWIATIDNQRAAYATALLAALARADRQCEVLEAEPHPELFMFEFVYRCPIPSAD